MPVAEKDRPKTAFITPKGINQFRVMPFGLCGALTTFQKMIDHVIRGKSELACAYLEDLIIYSVSWEDHLVHIQAVQDRIRSLGLMVKHCKCQLAMRERTYLGHIIGNGEVKPERSKLQAIAQFLLPTTKKQVR